MTNRGMLIETSANQLYDVVDHPDAELSHVWLGIPMKKVKNGYCPKANAKEVLVRKAGSKIVMEF